MILTKNRALQIAKQSEQHFRANYFTDIVNAVMKEQLENQLVRLLNRDGFDVHRNPFRELWVDIEVPNSNGTKTAIKYDTDWKVTVFKDGGRQ